MAVCGPVGESRDPLLEPQSSGEQAPTRGITEEDIDSDDITPLGTNENLDDVEADDGFEAAYKWLQEHEGTEGSKRRRLNAIYQIIQEMSNHVEDGEIDPILNVYYVNHCAEKGLRAKFDEGGNRMVMRIEE